MKTTRLTFQNRDNITISARLEQPNDQYPIAYAIFAHCFTCSKSLRAYENCHDGQRSKVQKCLQKCLDTFEYVCGSAVMIWDHPKQIQSVPFLIPTTLQFVILAWTRGGFSFFETSLFRPFRGATHTHAPLLNTLLGRNHHTKCTHASRDFVFMC